MLAATVGGRNNGNAGPASIGAIGLKDAYAGKFLVGAAGDIPRRYSDAELANIKANYNVITIVWSGVSAICTASPAMSFHR